MKIKKGDKVTIISGKDRGKSGNVLRVFPKQNVITVESVNMRKKHSRSKRQGQKGQVIHVAMPISASNVMLVCPVCNKPRRAGYKIFSAEGGSQPKADQSLAGAKNSAGENKKTRVCKKCGSEI